MGGPVNIAHALSEMARLRPQAIALRAPQRASRGAELPPYLDISYADLDAGSDRCAAALAHAGIRRGMKTALMVRPGRALFELMFALFKLGAVPVLIDPGIDRRALRQCLAEAAPEAFVGIPLAQIARILLGWARRSVRIKVTVGGRLAWGGQRLDALRAAVPAQRLTAAPTQADELAAILFTSGSTGVPKGVEYLHRHFLAQVELLREAFALAPGLVNMPTFPPFALFDPALGSTSVIPDMDPTRPASADPRKLVVRFNAPLPTWPALLVGKEGEQVVNYRVIEEGGAVYFVTDRRVTEAQLRIEDEVVRITAETPPRIV